MTRRLLPWLLALASACSPINAVTEICANKQDDDNNGLVDCDDPACSGKEGCPVKDTDAGYYGACVKCGRLCTNQPTCLPDAGYFYNEQPLPYCESGKCTSYRQKTAINFKLQGELFGGTMLARVVEKKAVDGSAVSCARLAQVRSTTASNTVDMAGFNVAGWIYKPVAANERPVNSQLNTTNSTNDYVVYVELWGGAPEASSKYPSGSLLSVGCLETGLVELAEKASCDGGVTCYPTMTLQMALP